MPQFIHHDLKLLNPSFDSPLLDVITELEFLRRLEMSGTTPIPVFLQLKHVFHLLESFASARIEGNHTTLADYIDSKVVASTPTDQLNEIENIEQAMNQVEDMGGARPAHHRAHASGSPQHSCERVEAGG